MVAALTSLYDFARNILTNILTLGQRTLLRLGELSLFINLPKYHNFLTLFTEWFLILFLLRDNEHTL